MLELLVRRVSGTEPGFSAKYVRWAIELDSRNGFTGLVELGQPDQKGTPGRHFLKCPDLTQSELVSGGSLKSHFLVETASVAAMYKVDPSDTKTSQKHDFFVDMLEQAGKSIPQLATIARFMKDEQVLAKIKQEMERKKVKATDKVTFRLDGEFPLEKDYWHNWWRTFRQDLIGHGRQPAGKIVSGGEGRAFRQNLVGRGRQRQEHHEFRCFATGQLVTPTSTHPKIKGLAKVGGLLTGDVLIGCDKEAFCSYGLAQSENAAVSEDAARAYTESLNNLIRGSGTTLAGAMVVHWFKEKVLPEDDPVAFLTEAAEIQQLDAQERARRLLRSLETGERPELVGNRYYILTMSGAAGRVMVRDWMEGEFTELVRNVNQWFDDLSIASIASPGSIAASPKLESVVTSLLPPREQGQGYADWVEPVGAARVELLRAAIQNRLIPYGVLARLLPVHHSLIHSQKWQSILKKERTNSLALAYSTMHCRMALIRAYHLRKYRKEGNKLADMLTPKLNKDFPNVAYQCGRLMAALAELQHAALGDVGAGVVQRYYAAASTTPALVLGRLISHSQHHLNKLEAGLARWYENIISEICNKISELIPRTLTLEEQSLFALGYYHQLASFRAGKSQDEKKED